MRFSEKEYHLPFFDEYGYVRKQCPKCGEYFWTLNPDQRLCGESTTYGCADYTFINDPPTRRKYTLREMREAFLSFFEKRGHKRIKPYLLVARWRDDLYFTNASIIDFQPYVTEGIIPPPANPLVIVQPCVRFPDIESVGSTFGRHLTIFEMGGHHAFNYPEKQVYWKDETVRLHHEFVTKVLGVKDEEVIYKEGIWSGGGNAGPDVESIIRGLEVATLVFMKYKVVDGEFVELPIKTVDTGYGIERFTWLSQGCISGFEAIYGDLLEKIKMMVGVEVPDEKLLADISRVSGLIAISKTSSRAENWRRVAQKVGVDAQELSKMIDPLVDIYAVADHTKCLTFLLAEGVVPSNVREGYLTRLLIRRTCRLLRNLSIEDKLFDIVEMQISFWSKDFPHLKEMRDEILSLLSIEKAKYDETLLRGRSLVRRMIREHKSKGVSEIPLEDLINLYDSHGLTPEVVSEMAEEEGVEIHIPENFYSYVAERHMAAPREERSPITEGIRDIEDEFSDLPETRKLYYEDAYVKEFKAKVLRVSGNRVVLDKTAFYPEGGGQPADQGFLEFSGRRSKVKDVQKMGGIVVHFLEGPIPEEGKEVRGIIDWKRRISLMRSHTATHIIMGAARRILGEHVWQAGAQKGVERSRIDFSHPKRLSFEEIKKIESLANKVVRDNRPVKVFWMPREEAEREYGFRIYQGGVVPGRDIRIVKVEDWDVEACGGTHCRNTGEIGIIKIIRTERIQDGVERIIFSVGESAVNVIQETEKRILQIADLLNVQPEKVERTVSNLVSELKYLRKEKEKLSNSLARYLAEKWLLSSEEINGVKLVSKIVNAKEADIDLLIKVSAEIVKREERAVSALICVDNNARLVVNVGREALKLGVDAREIAREMGSKLGGGGSGRPNFAQGGGTRIEGVKEAIEKAREVILSLKR